MAAVAPAAPRTTEEVMDKLEERVGPEGRRLFEQFLEKVNRLQLRQQQERQREQEQQHMVAVVGQRRRD
jgi:hypothetical protein